MPLVLAPMAESPKTVTLAAAATVIPPFACRINPFFGGNKVTAVGAANAVLVGASVNRFAALKHVRVVVAGADVTPAAGLVGQVAAARDAAYPVGQRPVTGDLRLVFGNAAGQIIDSITAHTDAADADTHLSVIVLVNGKPLGRLVDTAGVPAVGPNQFGMDNTAADNHNIYIGASTGTDAIRVGTEIDVFIGLNIGKCAEFDPTTRLPIAGTALAASVPEERYLGVISSYTDTAGRSVTGIVASDFIMAEAAAMSLVGTGL